MGFSHLSNKILHAQIGSKTSKKLHKNDSKNRVYVVCAASDVFAMRYNLKLQLLIVKIREVRRYALACYKAHANTLLTSHHLKHLVKK